jgi:beta-glucosidase
MKLTVQSFFRMSTAIAGMWSILAAAPQPGASSAVPAPLVTPQIEAQIKTLVAQMTLAEKIGQMTQAERSTVKKGEITRYFLGSILSGGGSVPADNSAKGWADMYDGFQAEALKTRLKIPLIYGVDAVHGHNNLQGATVFPHNIGLGATRDPDLVQRVCRATAAEVRATGPTWTFAPCIAVPRDERWGRTYEGFGETPELQQMFAAPAVKGFQGGGPLMTIAATAKHFVGDGGTAYGTSSVGPELLDQGDTRISEQELRTIHLPGYRDAVNAGVATVMASYSRWNGTRMHAQKYLLTDVLKKELGFQGFVVGDWEGVDSVYNTDFRASIKAAVNAGLDMTMEPQNWRKFISLLTDLVNKKEVPMERIDDAVTRILRVKYATGLFDHPLTARTGFDTVGCASHRALAREAVAKSLVLLKNDNGLLPLGRQKKTIVVTGSHCNDAGRQCGGWTLTWQGQAGPMKGATTILDGIRQVAAKDSIIWGQDATVIKGVDAAIIVVGEPPYAEMEGDRKSDELVLDTAARTMIAAYHAAGIPVVTVLVSGRPLLIDRELALSDAFVAAWLPGTEGAGVADVLFGAAAPTGRLGHSWPSSAGQIPINKGDGKKPLFDYGYGLTYGKK